ncbi:unnamed protein product [Auanema sp. JU1783]|nr:unnamed protein product [Auanema sp. JU1783]
MTAPFDGCPFFCSERKHQALANPKLTALDFSYVCQRYYKYGWMRGCGGAMACLQGNILFVTPEDVQKDRLTPKQIFILNVETKILEQSPPELQPTLSCPIFTALMLATRCATVIHTNSPVARAICRLSKKPYFEISHREHLSQVPFPVYDNLLSNTNTMKIPIIENQATEDELAKEINRIVNMGLTTDGVLVRNNGLIVWGSTWEETEFLAKSFDRLFRIALTLSRQGKPWVVNNTHLRDQPMEYREMNNNTI